MEEDVSAVMEPDFIFTLVVYGSHLSSFGDAFVEMCISGILGE